MTARSHFVDYLGFLELVSVPAGSHGIDYLGFLELVFVPAD